MLVLLQRGGGGVVLGIAEVDQAGLAHIWALARALDGGSGWSRSGGGVRKEVDDDVLAA